MELTKELEELLLTKPFSVLSDDEKKLALKYFCEEEYELAHLLLRQASDSSFDQVDLEPQPSPALMKAFKNKRSESIKASSISASQLKKFLVAALVLIVSGLFLWRNHASQKPGNSNSLLSRVEKPSIKSNHRSTAPTSITEADLSITLKPKKTTKMASLTKSYSRRAANSIDSNTLKLSLCYNLNMDSLAEETETPGLETNISDEFNALVNLP